MLLELLVKSTYRAYYYAFPILIKLLKLKLLHKLQDIYMPNSILLE